LLFFISKKGWKDADDRLIALFIVISAAAACFGAMPTMFRQEDNIAENKSLYLQYRALENEQISFFSTNEDLSTGDETRQRNKDIILVSKDFIHKVDQQLNRLNSFAVGFDASKVPKQFIPDLTERKAPGKP
jgi:hypothetical protein